jgi:hypothetical protein
MMVVCMSVMEEGAGLTDVGCANAGGDLLAQGLADRDVAFFEDALVELSS